MNIILQYVLTGVLLYILIPYTLAQTSLPANVRHIGVKRLNDSQIDAYILVKDTTVKRPLLIFCQGSGYDSNSEGFLGLASKYSNIANGLVLEKQGVKYGDDGKTLTEEYKQNNTIYHRVFDYLRVLEYLRKKADWWDGNIYVIGGSEGGLIAGLLASFYPNTKGLAILCYGGGLKFGEAWPISEGLIKKSEGGNATQVSAREKEVKDSLLYIRQHPTFKKSFSGEDNTYAWWASIMDLRLSNALIDLEIPIFVGQGTEDMMALPESARKLKQEFEKQGKTNLFLKEYKGYNHAFQDQEQKSHLVEVFIEALDWILKR